MCVSKDMCVHGKHAQIAWVGRVIYLSCYAIYIHIIPFLYSLTKHPMI